MKLGRLLAGELASALDFRGIEPRATFWSRLPLRAGIVLAVGPAAVLLGNTLNGIIAMTLASLPLLASGVRRLRDAGADRPADAVIPWLWAAGACVLASLGASAWATMSAVFETGQSPAGFYAWITYGPLVAVLFVAALIAAVSALVRLGHAIGFLLLPSEIRPSAKVGET